MQKLFNNVTIHTNLLVCATLSLLFGSSRDLFIEHLDKMKENTHHKREVKNNVQNQYHEEMDSDCLTSG